MGRGRAKAKQTKVARELKYQTLATDFGALQRELGSPGQGAGSSDEYEAYDGEHDDDDEVGDDGDDDVDPELDDRYAAYADLADESTDRDRSAADR